MRFATVFQGTPTVPVVHMCTLLCLPVFTLAGTCTLESYINKCKNNFPEKSNEYADNAGMMEETKCF